MIIKILKYGIATLVASILGLITFRVRTYGMSVENLDLINIYRVLHDTFLIPGVVVGLVGVLVVLSNEGSFDGVAYSVKYAIKMLIPGAKKDHVKYGDYIEAKRAKGKTTGFGFLLIVGLAFFAISLIFLALYYYEGNQIINSLPQ